LHHAVDFERDEFRGYAAFSDEVAEVAVEGVLIDHGAKTAAVGLRLVPACQVADRVRAERSGSPGRVGGPGLAANPVAFPPLSFFVVTAVTSRL
jgi:hypothetical protein